MEGNNWRPARAEPAAANDAEVGDWRLQLHRNMRQRVVDKIMDVLKRHLPISVPEGFDQLQKIAVHLEEKIYSRATSMSDYLRKNSLKMLSMEMKTQYPSPINPSIQNTTVLNQNATDPGMPPARIDHSATNFDGALFSTGYHDKPKKKDLNLIQCRQYKEHGHIVSHCKKQHFVLLVRKRVTSFLNVAF
ncbi:hypothetical protein COCNU_09G009000 [Cocos nucifera]|uniref:Mediator complex subunit 15 KIX domain-containing protein n=1 Tax=Cocos nucifera TaxID=13894 RepID=A0A8K0IKM1_COCNU|nr:hypothetical protein COCNU_09G009000 [Cocos nucifera]